MNKQEVNRVIIRLIPDLMKMVLSKTKHREHKARKKGYPNEVSSYEIKGVKFWVYYFIDEGTDVNQIFCHYYDNIGAVYAYVKVGKPGQYSILHFLKHAIDQYNSRLGLGLDNIKDILFHVAKHGLIMFRKEIPSEDENWLDVGWKCSNGLWLGKSKSKEEVNNTYVSIAKTFIDNSLVRLNQEAQLDDDMLEKLKLFEQDIGGDSYARRRISQLISLCKNKS